MSTLNLSDINDIDTDKNKSVNLLIASIALVELGLANIINAEADKINFVLAEHAHRELPTIDELLQINKSVQQTLKLVIKKEIILEFLLDDALDLEQQSEENEEEHG